MKVPWQKKVHYILDSLKDLHRFFANGEEMIWNGRFAHFAEEKASILFECSTMNQYVRYVADAGRNVFRNMRFPAHIARVRVFNRTEGLSAPYAVEPVLSAFMNQQPPARNARQKACLRVNICLAGHAGEKGRYLFDNKRISAVAKQMEPFTSSPQRGEVGCPISKNIV
jgi:hypothetical protein